MLSSISQPKATFHAISQIVDEEGALVEDMDEIRDGDNLVAQTEATRAEAVARDAAIALSMASQPTGNDGTLKHGPGEGKDGSASASEAIKHYASEGSLKKPGAAAAGGGGSGAICRRASSTGATSVSSSSRPTVG